MSTGIPPDPFGDIREALPAIQQFLANLPGPTIQESQTQQAVRTVWTAVDTTKMHLRRLAEGQEEPTANTELVDLWRRASVAIAPYDDELALRLREKAEFWSDPAYWRPQQIEEADIAIDAVAARARDLIRLFAQEQPRADRDRAATYDFFISHATEDKSAIARPLVDSLSERGCSVWYDESDLGPGDELLSGLDQGLAASRFGVLILSHHFFAKPWPTMELAGFLALETADGRKRILPVRHGLSHEELVRKSPILAGRVAISTEGGLGAVVDRLLQTLG